MTTNRAFRRAVNRFERVTIDLAFKGTRPPYEHAAIEEEYTRAWTALIRFEDRIGSKHPMMRDDCR